MGLNLNIVDKNLIKWTGADAFRICQYNTELDSPLEANGNIIIPKKSLLEIRKILEFDNDKITVLFDENTFQISVNQIMFKTRLIEAEFPNLDRLLVINNENTVEVKKTELINAVRILNTFTEGDSKSVMKLTVSDGKILVESQKLEFGEGNDEIVCEYSGNEIKIGLNIKFFLDALHAFESSLDESIIIHITSTEVPVMLRCNGWENFKTVLMPVRIQW
jgi:DNA polymerase-3 subunit beta